MKNEKVYLVSLITDNPSANRLLGLFTADKVEDLKKKWSEIEKNDSNSQNPFYGKCQLEIDEFTINEDIS
jgi:hypothetical protein